MTSTSKCSSANTVNTWQPINTGSKVHVSQDAIKVSVIHCDVRIRLLWKLSNCLPSRVSENVKDKYLVPLWVKHTVETPTATTRESIWKNLFTQRKPSVTPMSDSLHCSTWRSVRSSEEKEKLTRLHGFSARFKPPTTEIHDWNRADLTQLKSFSFLDTDHLILLN